MAFVNRMVNDSEFRERVLAFNQQEPDSRTAESWRTAMGTGPADDQAGKDGHDRGFEEDSREQQQAEDDGAEALTAGLSVGRLEQVRVVAQALAFRSRVSLSEVTALTRLVNAAYTGECAEGQLGGVAGSGRGEGFRPSGGLLDEETVRLMVKDPDCEWLIAEAPCGRGVVPDGAVLGVCCFSTGGAAASAPPPPAPEQAGGDSSASQALALSASPPDTVGAVRVLAVSAVVRGLCVGTRLLERVEGVMRKARCARMLCCIPEHRFSMLAWASRRGFKQVGTANFPPEVVATFSRPTILIVVAKEFQTAALSTAGGGALTPAGFDLPD